MLLRLRDLSSGYARRRVLEHISLDVEEGGITLLVGPNGSGKSTLFRTLFGLATVYSAGKCEFMGHEIFLGSRDPWFRRQVSYVPQYKNVFGTLSVEENLNIALGASWSSRQGSDVIAVIGNQLKSRFVDSAGNLSGGQKQLLAISFGLRPSCRLLLLDEPLAGLDSAATVRVAETIKNLAQRLTIIVAEHRYSQLAPFADRLVGLKAGRIVLDLIDCKSLASEVLKAKTEEVFFGRVV